MIQSKEKTCTQCKWSAMTTSEVECVWHRFNLDKIPPIYGISVYYKYIIYNITAEYCPVFTPRPEHEVPWNER